MEAETLHLVEVDRRANALVLAQRLRALVWLRNIIEFVEHKEIHVTVYGRPSRLVQGSGILPSFKYSTPEKMALESLSTQEKYRIGEVMANAIAACTRVRCERAYERSDGGVTYFIKPDWDRYRELDSEALLQKLEAETELEMEATLDGPSESGS
jgi:hypothetical protein